MEKLFVSYCIEYESGWGQRPDGCYIAEDLDELKEFILKQGDSGSYDCFWRCSTPEEFLVESSEGLKAFYLI